MSRKGKQVPKVNKAVAYARVSSKEQDKEGFSIPAQQKLLQGYAQQHGLVIASEFVDIETAKHTGRASFTEMVRFLKIHPQIGVVLVEKTDRLYRNLKDWVTLDELDIEIHLVKEGVILSGESKSSEKFVHGIKVLIAKNYIDNLSEEARKGQQEKAEQGFWPTKAPLGYRNVQGPDGKRVIAPDPETAPVVRHLFAWYASGKGKCGEPYVRQEVLEERFETVLNRLRFGDQVLAWLGTALRESHADEKKEHETAIARLQGEYERLQNRIHAIYIDKLDGRIDLHFFEKLSADMLAQQDACLREIALHQAADQDYLEEGARLLDLAQGASCLFAKQDAHQKRRLLNFVLSNSTWKSGELSVRFRQPFDLLAETAAAIATEAGMEGLNSPGHSGWLGDLDSNQD